jgi:hypothetical protein
MKHFGRLIFRLEGNTKMYVKEVGLYGLNEDRAQWCAVVKTVINHFSPFFIYLWGNFLTSCVTFGFLGMTLLHWVS